MATTKERQITRDLKVEEILDKINTLMVMVHEIQKDLEKDEKNS